MANPKVPKSPLNCNLCDGSVGMWRTLTNRRAPLDARVAAWFAGDITGFSPQDRLEFKDVVADHDAEGGAGTHGDGEATGAFRCPTCGQFTATDFSAD